MTPGDTVQLIIFAFCALTAASITVLAYKAWRGDKYLCDDCKYNDPAQCLKPERPHATDCAAYMRKEGS